MAKILVVDDDKYALQTIVEIVRSLGYRAKAAASGHDALELLQKEKFDLVLLDVLMPKMSGVQVLKKIRRMSKLKKLKVAFLTVVKLSDIDVSIDKMPNVYYVDKAAGIKNLKVALKGILKD